jgi:hypothetical protein
MCAWTGKTTTGTLAVNMDWDEEQVSDALMATLTTGAQAGVVSQKTYSWNLKEAGRFPEDWSVDDELEEIERENLSQGPEPFATGNPAMAGIPPQGMKAGAPPVVAKP